MTPTVVLVVLLAGAGGAVVRYLVSVFFESGFFADRSRFPWAVLVVNVVGSGVAGAVLGLAVRFDWSSDIRLILLTGLCGGLTTFSTWSVESLQLVDDGKAGIAAASVAGNLALGIGAAAAAFVVCAG